MLRPATAEMTVGAIVKHRSIIKWLNCELRVFVSTLQVLGTRPARFGFGEGWGNIASSGVFGLAALRVARANTFLSDVSPPLPEPFLAVFATFGRS